MRSLDYWVLRASREKNLDIAIEELIKELQRCYLKSANDLIPKLEKLYLEILSDTKGEVLISHLYQYNRYYDIVNEINEELRNLGFKEAVLFEDELTGVYEYNRKLINPTWNLAINKSAVEETINRIWVGDENWSSRIWKNTNKLSQTVRESLIQTFATGSTTDDFVKNLMKDFSVSYNQAKTLARTELAHCATQATIDGYIEMGVTQYKVITEKDCCEECNDLSNKVFDINDPEGYVPMHPNCRCSIVAIV
jgi:SPP1 gp7 family putative phage head morphogenesis protein